MGVTFPDSGPTPSSVFQGFVFMAVFAAPAVSTLVAPERALSVGCAMFVAGAALLPGGNLLGLLMLIPGVVLASAGIRARPAVQAPGWMWPIGNAAVLVLAVFLAVDPRMISWLIAMGLAVGVTLANSIGSPHHSERVIVGAIDPPTRHPE